MSGIELLGLAGGVLSAGGTLLGASAKAESDRAEAELLNRKAENERAYSQREAIRKAHETARVLSRQQALAANSGGGATDPTVVDLMAGAAGQGALQGQTILAQGEEQGAMDDYKASYKRYAADQTEMAGWIGAGSSFLSGYSGWSKFGKDFFGPRNYRYG